MSRALRRTFLLDGVAREAVLRAVEGRVVGTLADGDETRDVDLAARRLGPAAVRLELDDRTVRAHVVTAGDVAWVCIDGRTYEVTVEEPGARAAGSGVEEDFATSPMTGTLAKVGAEPGATIAEGAELFVVEAMKMEYVVKAPRDLVVAEVRGAVGAQVEQGAVVVTFETDGGAA